MLPTKWRVFQVVCVIQMLMAAFHAAYSFLLMLITARILFYGMQVVAFISVLLFANLGSSILNYNYPDKPVIDKQRKQFNLLYIINFLVLSFLVSHLYIEVSDVTILFFMEGVFGDFLFLLLPSIFYLLIVAGQVAMLVGMFKLRREIFQRFYAEANNMASQES